MKFLHNIYAVDMVWKKFCSSWYQLPTLHNGLEIKCNQNQCLMLEHEYNFLVTYQICVNILRHLHTQNSKHKISGVGHRENILHWLYTFIIPHKTLIIVSIFALPISYNYKSKYERFNENRATKPRNIWSTRSDRTKTSHGLLAPLEAISFNSTI